MSVMSRFRMCWTSFEEIYCKCLPCIRLCGRMEPGYRHNLTQTSPWTCHNLTPNFTPNLTQLNPRLYDLARQGIEVERPLRPVTVYGLSLERKDLPEFGLAVDCSGGLYVRTLIVDIARAVQSGDLPAA